MRRKIRGVSEEMLAANPLFTTPQKPPPPAVPRGSTPVVEHAPRAAALSPPPADPTPPPPPADHHHRWAAGKGIAVGEVVCEVGSGLDGKRPKVVASLVGPFCECGDC